MNTNMEYQILSMLGLALSCSGNILVNFKKRSGFIIWSISNLIWIVVNLIAVEINWFQLIMFLIYIGLNVHGFINWKGNNDVIKYNCEIFFKLIKNYNGRGDYFTISNSSLLQLLYDFCEKEYIDVDDIVVDSYGWGHIKVKCTKEKHQKLLRELRTNHEYKICNVRKKD